MYFLQLTYSGLTEVSLIRSVNGGKCKLVIFTEYAALSFNPLWERSCVYSTKQRGSLISGYCTVLVDTPQAKYLGSFVTLTPKWRYGSGEHCPGQHCTRMSAGIFSLSFTLTSSNLSLSSFVVSMNTIICPLLLLMTIWQEKYH